MTQSIDLRGAVPEWDLADRMRKSLRTAGMGVQEMADDDPAHIADLYRAPADGEDTYDYDPFVDDIADEPAMPDADYPHTPGYLHDCAACESACHCAPGADECVFGGEHNDVAMVGGHGQWCVGEHCSRCGVCTMGGNGALCDDCRQDLADQSARVSLCKSAGHWPYTREDIGMPSFRVYGPVDLDITHPWRRGDFHVLKASFEGERVRLWALCQWARQHGHGTLSGILQAALWRTEGIVDGGGQNASALRSALVGVRYMADVIRGYLVDGDEPVIIDVHGRRVIELNGRRGLNGWVRVTIAPHRGEPFVYDVPAHDLLIVS